MLPEVVASDALLGPIRIGDRDLDVRAILCDQPSALLGTGCLAPGDVKCTYGTGAFVQVNVGEASDEAAPRGAPGQSAHEGLLRSIAWELEGVRTHLLEGSVLSAGDVLTWLRDGLGMIARPEEIDEVLARTPDSAGVLFVPALTGLGAPRWVGDARGTILGLNRSARREHVIRAAIEGIAHQVADVLDVASRALGGALAPMWADGGLSASEAFLQLQADLAGHPLKRAAQGEATTRGVGAVAATGAGLTPSIREAVHTDPSLVITPSLGAAEREARRDRHRRLMDLIASPALLELCR
jgi:glycerol kinase